MNIIRKTLALALVALAAVSSTAPAAAQSFTVPTDRFGSESVAAQSYSKLVYIDTTSPLTATIFDEASPPTTNDPALKGNSDYAYIGSDGTVWTCTNATTCKTAPAPTPTTEWVIAGTSVDAGADKTGAIARAGKVAIGKTTHSSAHALEVVSNLQIKDTGTAGAGAGYGFEINTNSNAPRMDLVFNGAYVGQFAVNANDFQYRNSKVNTGRHVFSTTQGAGQVDQVIIENDGRVWIRNTPLITTATEVLVRDPTTGHVSRASIASLVKWQTTRIVATAGQTSFTLGFTPNGSKVAMFRNGVRIDPNAYSVSGTTVTYVPANNGSAALGAMVAGDIVVFDGIQ